MMEMLTMSQSQTITDPPINFPPSHPGEFLTDELEAIGISPAQLARVLGIPANRVTEIIAGRRGVTADTALRLERFKVGNARMWMALQDAYELAETALRIRNQLDSIQPHTGE